MTQKERLVHLIIDSVNGCARNWAEVIAEHLLANGVIVPPCKVGDTVYAIFGAFQDHIAKCMVNEFCIEKSGVYAVVDVYYGDFVARRSRAIPIGCFGVYAFLTREEMEKALAEITDKNLQE